MSEYSSDGKLLAFINSDGKLKIWDTETSELRQEFTPKLHLSVPFTCFTWITIDNAVVSKEVGSCFRQQKDYATRLFCMDKFC